MMREHPERSSLEYFQFFHRLPVIQSTTIDGVQRYQAERERVVPRTSNVKKIRIKPVDISGAMLSVIILIPNPLEELRLSLGGL
jgi:hypothetical protein